MKRQFQEKNLLISKAQEVTQLLYILFHSSCNHFQSWMANLQVLQIPQCPILYCTRVQLLQNQNIVGATSKRVLRRKAKQSKEKKTEKLEQTRGDDPSTSSRAGSSWSWLQRSGAAGGRDAIFRRQFAIALSPDLRDLVSFDHHRGVPASTDNQRDNTTCGRRNRA